MCHLASCNLRCFFFNDTATTQIYTYCHTLSHHYALPISERQAGRAATAKEVSEEAAGCVYRLPDGPGVTGRPSCFLEPQQLRDDVADGPDDRTLPAFELPCARHQRMR